MKTFLRAIAIALLCVPLHQAFAQPCNVTNPTISNVSRTSNGGGSCTLTFDLDFTIDNNGGSKVIVIHLWPALSYPNLPYANATNANELTTSYGTITIDNDITAGHPAPTYYAGGYPFEAGVTNLVTSGQPLRSGVAPYNFHLGGITIPNVSCTNVIGIKGDVWATNAGALNTNANVHCVTKNINLIVGDPTLTAPFKTCASPRTINFQIGTTQSSSIQVSYKIYRDDNFFSGGQPVFNPLADVEVTAAGTLPVTVNNTTPASVSASFQGNTAPGENSHYWVVATYTPPAGGSATSIAKITSNSCAPLPVKFTSFSATRTGNNVVLKWETATEENNAGFSIQRKLNTDAWRDVSFVPSAAVNGNSTGELSYQYNDFNSYNGVSQYRLLQKDIDGRSAYSEIKLVKGESQHFDGISVFPNPSKGGNISILLEGNGFYEITVLDGNGRMISQYSDVKGSKVIGGLRPGQYLVVAENKQDGTKSSQKIIVQ